jgi:hypothetical protein
MKKYIITPHEPTTDEELESLRHEICAKAMHESIQDKKKAAEKEEQKQKEQQKMYAYMSYIRQRNNSIE